VDSGSFTLVTYNRSSQYNESAISQHVCVGLTIDSTTAKFLRQNSGNCKSSLVQLEMGEAASISNISATDILLLDNSLLHNWYPTDGDLGVSYCGKQQCDEYTAFQSLVQNAALESMNDGEVFGLDFRSTDCTINKYLPGPDSSAHCNSSLQLGNVSAEFADSINWISQSTTAPKYHQFFIQDFKMCGTLLLGNYSTSWNVLVDTGAVCMTLPSEIYDSFERWFNESSIVDDINELPSFSFQMSSGSNSDSPTETSIFYIPLADLVINASAIETEKGAPFITTSSSTSSSAERQRLCVLRGDALTYDSNGQQQYTDPAPEIVFGALTLQSLYFAADFATYRVGLANKLTDSYIEGTRSNKQCSAKRSCLGDQTYIPSINSCSDSDCHKYFFSHYDDEKKVCNYDMGAMVGGLFFILLIASAEIVSFFSNQYSMHSAMEHTRQLPPMDPITKYAGWATTTVLDVLVVHVLQWAPARRNRVTAAGGGGGAGGGRGGANLREAAQGGGFFRNEVEPLEI
jgi:hypothetical protein